MRIDTVPRESGAPKPSDRGNRSLWVVTAERVRDGKLSEGEDVASMNIPGI